MRSLSVRFLLSLFVLALTPAAFAHDVTITGTQNFASLDGSASDHDGSANGVFTVNDGNLVVNGVVNCNDDTTTSACPMAFSVSGNMTINSGGALYAENRSGGGTGGAITLTVGGNLALNGDAIVSTASKTSSGSTGGAITATVSGSVALASGTTIDSGASNARGGNITVAAGNIISVDGNVLSGPSRTILSTRLTGLVLDGGTGNSIGGAITIGSSTFVEPALTVGSNANIVSQGADGGAGPITLDACGIQIRGLVAGLSRKDSAAQVSIRSGKDVLVDGRDLGATGTRMGRVRSDAPSGTAANKGVDIFAGETIDIFGPTGTLFVITSLPGLHDSKSYGGLIRVMSLGDAVNASGNVIDDGHTASGDSGGTVEISAKGDTNLNAAVIRAVGDFTTNNSNRGGGAIRVRSYSGNVIWTNGTGDVRPVGSASGLAPGDQGTIVLTACGTVSTTGSTFPVMGTATSMFPETHTGVCSPAAPSLPSGVSPLVTCNTPPVANDTSATTNEDTTVTITLSGSDADGDSLTFTIVSGPSNGTLGAVISTGPTTATVDYTPALNYNGTDSFVFRANDGNGGTDDATASIVINPVNDPPTFQIGPTVVVLEDSGAHTIPNWVTAISPGPADESGQAVTFTVTNNNPSLFTVQPAVAPNGTLAFTLAANAYGTATITVVAQDNGGIANGGNDTSAPQTSSINVTGVNDEPSFVKGADQVVNEDAGPQTVTGWATAISAGPNEGGQTLTFFTSTPQSSLFSAQPAVDASGTLTYTPVANANGTATVSIYLMDNGGTADSGDDTSPTQTFTITINAVNDEPLFTGGGNVTVLEDSGAYSATWATAISAGPTDESGQTLTFTTSNDNNALFSSQPSISASGLLTFTPASNAYGTATVTVTLSDSGGTLNGGDDTSPAQTFTITVTPVNDEPSFASGGNVTVNEDSGAYSAAWATAISAGPNESSQTVTFHTSNDNNALFSSQPSISSSGVLTFTPAADAFGTATVTVYLTDDGGIADGGDDTSPSQTFVITVNSVNDAPSFTGGGNVTVDEDSGAYSAAWATAISAGPANESSQVVTFNVTNNNNALFSVQPSVSSTGVLSFTPAANTTGSATVTIFAQDDGGIANGGVNVSPSQTFTITVSDVNDPPTFTPGGDQTSNEDAGPQSVVWATSISAGPPNESGQTVTFFVSNDNNPLFSAQPSIDSTGTLTYTAAPNANGVATVSVYAQDNGGGNDTSATYTFTITIVAVNDAPSFTGGGNVTVNEDSGAYSAAWATAISAGPPDESGQALTFNVVSNSNPSLFASGPSISSTGVLSFTPAANAFGSASITINLQDDGGIANGGSDTSASYTFTITVNAVNDAPSFTPGGDVTVNEDSGPYAAPWATGISAGPANESGQTLNFVVTNNNNALFLVQPSIDANTGVLTFTTNLNANGSAIVSVTLHDNGGIANGGVDTSATVQFTITVTAVNDGPTAAADAWDTLGNTELRVDFPGGLTPKVVDTTTSGNGVTDNDSDPEGDPFVITGIVGCSDVTAPFDCTLGDGSKVSMLANGSFSYTPGPGNTTGSFQYTLTDVPVAGAPVSTTGTVTITIYDRIWYVNGSAVAGGNGTSISPFNNFASLNGAGDADSPGDTIFVHTSAVIGNIAMEANEKLWGQGVGLSTNQNLNGNGSPQVLVAPGVKPTVVSGGDTVSVTGVTGVDIAGLSLTSTSGNAIDVTSALAGPAAGATIRENTIAGATLEGIDVNANSASTTTVEVTNTSITSTGNGFDVASGGPAVVSYAGGTITSSGGIGIRMDGTVSGNLTVSGLSNVTIDGNTAGAGISINTAKFDAIAGGSFNTVNGGTIVVGASGNPVGGAGVLFTNVSGDYAIGSLTVFGGTSGATIGGSGLFTGSAGMRITSGAGSISAPSGVGLSVTNATIGAANLNFTSISAANGANGIALTNNGASGRLVVSGTGAAGSGGTIQNTTSHGIALSSTQGPSLSFVNVNATGANGIDASNTSGLTLTSCQITNAGNGDNEHGMRLLNVSGTVAVSGSTFSNAAEDLINVDNNNTNMTLTVGSSSQFTHGAVIGAFTGNGIVMTARGTTGFNVNVSNSTFTNVKLAAVQVGGDGTASGTSTVNVTSNQFTVNITGRACYVNVQARNTSNVTLGVVNNTLQGTGAGTINIGADESTVVQATVTGNNISNSVAHGILAANDDNSRLRLLVDGNVLTNIGSDGIEIANFGGVGTSELDAVVTNNTVNGHNTNPSTAFIAGIAIFGFEDSTCAVLRGNSVTGTTAGFYDYSLEELDGTMMLEEIPDTPATIATSAYILSTNSGSSGNVDLFGTIDLTNGASCDRP